MPATIYDGNNASSASSKSTTTQQTDEMRIAWRYNNLDKVDSEQGRSSQADGKNNYYFDLSQQIDQNTLDKLDISVFGESASIDKENPAFTNQIYASLLSELHKKLSNEAYKFNAHSSQTPDNSNDSKISKNILRVAIQSLGSPLWWNENFANDLCLFLLVLKALIRNSIAICCITVPTHLFMHFVSIG